MINSNKTRVEEKMRKEVEEKKIKQMKRQAVERKKEEEEELKEVEKLAAQMQGVRDIQSKAEEACKAEVDSLTKVDGNNLSTKDLIKLGEKLKEAIRMKKKDEEERSREVKKRIEYKK